MCRMHVYRDGEAGIFYSTICNLNLWVGLLSQVMQWIKQSGHPHLSPSLGKDLRACEEQQSKLESHNETVEVKNLPSC